MSSKLIYQTKDYVVIEVSLTCYEQEGDWQINDKGESRFGRDFDLGWHHAFDTLDLQVLVSKSTGAVVRIINGTGDLKPFLSAEENLASNLADYLHRTEHAKHLDSTGCRHGHLETARTVLGLRDA